MNDEVLIRPFAPQDIGQTVELLQLLSAFRPAAGQLDALGQAFCQQQESYACVAVQGERLVGFSSLFVLRRIRGGASAVIEDMVVAPDLRGRGVGKRLLQDLLAQARARRCFKVSLESSEMGQAFYRAAGFEGGGSVMKIQL